MAVFCSSYGPVLFVVVEKDNLLALSALCGTGNFPAFGCLTMLYRILADLVILLHLLFIVFVVAGGTFALYRTWLALLHLPSAVWGAYIEFSGNICPLTPLENHLSHLAGHKGYSSSFIGHYLIPIVYPGGLTHEIQIYLGLFVVVVNLILYSLVIRRQVCG